MAKKTSSPPQRQSNNPPLTTPAAQDFNKSTPRFCLRHLQPGYGLSELDTQKQADFALALQKRAKMLWKEILLADRHGLGTETLPSNQIKPEIPPDLQDRDKFLVFRYSGKLPMLGFRTTDTFHVVWIEARFGMVYHHG